MASLSSLLGSTSVACCVALSLLGPTLWQGFPASSPAGFPGLLAPSSGPSTTNDTIRITGIDPQAVSLSWSQTVDSCFDNYTLLISQSGSNGPWFPDDVINDSSQTTEIQYGLAPGTTYWWSILDTDCLGSQQGDVVQSFQPADPALSITHSATASVTLSWRNPAEYGGALGFGSYAVLESVDGGPSLQVANITGVGVTNYTIWNLNASTMYGFTVGTIDTGFGVLLPATYSTSVSFRTPAPFTVLGLPPVEGYLAVGGVASIAIAAVVFLLLVRPGRPRRLAPQLLKIPVSTLKEPPTPPS